MQDLATQLAALSTGAWVMAVAAATVPVSVVIARFTARHHRQNRIHRRPTNLDAAPSHGLVQPEPPDDDGSDEADLPKSLGIAASSGIFASATILFSELGVSRLWWAAAGICFLLSLVFPLWGRVNGPAEQPHLDFSPPQREIPREATLGFVGALGFAALTVLLIVYVKPF
jgi:hypothetical protein